MNQPITREQAAHMIHTLAEHDAQLQAAFDRLDAAVGDTIDGPLTNAAWGVFLAWLDTIDKLLGGQNSSALEWFAYENDWGANGLAHSLPDGTMREVHDVDDILDVIGY